MLKSIFTCASLIICLGLYAQEDKIYLSLQAAIDTAIIHSHNIRLEKLKEKNAAVLINSAYDVPQTQLSGNFGHYNGLYSNNAFTLSQSFKPFGYYKRQLDFFTENLNVTKANTKIKITELKKTTAQQYIDLMYYTAAIKMIEGLDSVYKKVLKISQLKYEKGETNFLEKASLDYQMNEYQIRMQSLQADKASSENELKVLLMLNKDIVTTDSFTNKHKLFDSFLLSKNVYINYEDENLKFAQAQVKLAKNKLLPEFSLSYSSQTNAGWTTTKAGDNIYYDADKRFSSFSIGVAYYLFKKNIKSQIASAKISEQTSNLNKEWLIRKYSLAFHTTLSRYKKNNKVVDFYEKTGKQHANALVQHAFLNYQNGTISFIEWTSLMNQALKINMDGLDAYKKKYETEIELEYLLQ